MAAPNFPRPLFPSAGYGFSTRSDRIPFSFSLRAVNGDDSSSPEERARISLKELDDQLLSNRPTAPRPPRDIKTEDKSEDKRKKAPVKGSFPVLSDGLLLYIAGGLFLLTVVNNFLFYFFIDLPNRNSEITKQEKNSDSTKGRTADMSKIAPQLRAGD